MLVFWGSKWCKSPKCKVLGLFSLTTSFKICVFNTFALIARRSKYDFWIPGGILTLEIKIQKKLFFLDVKIFGSKFFFGDFFGPIFFPNPKSKFSILD